MEQQTTRAESCIFPKHIYLIRSISMIMQIRTALLSILLLTGVAFAGCTGSEGTTSTATTAASTTTTTTPATTTTTAATNSSGTDHPVSGAHLYALPLILQNKDNKRHTVQITIQGGTKEKYKQSVTINAHERKRLYTLTGNGSTYRINAVMGDKSLNKKITLSGGAGSATLVISTSGDLHYSGPSQ